MAHHEPEESELKRLFLPRLQEELADLERQSEETADHRAPVELDQQSVGRLSRMDAIRAQATANAVEQRRKTRGMRLKAALARMGEGEFGYCSECGEFIGMKRLDVDPTAHLCVTCAAGSGG